MSHARSTDRDVIIWRVQAADGRGPWRPGLSKHWIDENSEQRLPDDVLSAFGLGWRDEIPLGWHAGCACRKLEGVLAWFTPVERGRLDAMGYKPVAMYADKLLRENDDQVVFVRRLPLYVAAVPVPWEQPDLETALRSLRHPRHWKAA